MKAKTRYYRGWRVGLTIGTRDGTTIYGDSFSDLLRRIDAYMDDNNWKRRGNL